MKKIIVLVLSALMMFGLAACGSNVNRDWSYSKEDAASFHEAFSAKALNQDEDGIDVISIYDIELDNKINAKDVLIFNYDLLEEDDHYRYVSYDLITKYEFKTEKIIANEEPGRYDIYFYGDDDFFLNYGVLIHKDITKDGKYIITKTQEEYLGGDGSCYGLELTFEPLFSYIDAKGITMQKIIEDGVINESVAEKFANNKNLYIQQIGRLCSYLDCEVKDIVRFDEEGTKEVTHEIDWDVDAVMTQEYDYPGRITFMPLRNYLDDHNSSLGELYRQGVIIPLEMSRIMADHNFSIAFVMKLCKSLSIDVSDVISYVVVPK